MNKILNYIENEEQRYLDELNSFLKFPSISADPGHKQDMADCADWLMGRIKDAGIGDVRLMETPGHPIIYAEWKGAGENAPTLLVYGHYDVQPADPIDLWDTPPFEPQVRDGFLYARGSSDDKGQLYTYIKAVEAFFKVNGNMPVNIKFLIEGEEEAQESHLDDFIKENKDMLACDVVAVSDTEWFADDLPSICYGLRGIAFAEVNLTGPNRDLHSGTFGGAVDNPVEVLCRLISKLKDEYGRVTIPGFYDDVRELTQEEREDFRKLPYDEKSYCEDLGVASLRGEHGYTTMERTWARPTLELNGVSGGYAGEGIKTVLPSKSHAKISMRLVPHQNAEDIAGKLESFLKQLAPPTVKIEVKAAAGGNPVLVPRDSIAVEAAKKAFKKAFGKETVFMREGGSIPIVELFDTVLKAPTALLGLGLPTDNIHSPNENFALKNYYGGIRTAAYFIDETGKGK